jgi:hypothetical protein
MIFLLLYFLVGAIASIYVLLRFGVERFTRAETIVSLVLLLAAWPIILTAPYWIFLGGELRRFLEGPWGRK